MERIIISLLICLNFGCAYKQHTTDQQGLEKLSELVKIRDSTRDLKQSIFYYSKILEIDSSLLWAITGRGRALIWDGQLEKGFADFNKLVQLEPTEERFFQRGMAYCQVKEFNKALADFENVLKMNSKNSGAHFGMSLIKSDEGDFDSALVYLERAETLGFSKELVMQIRAEVFGKQGNYMAAIAEQTKVIQFNMHNALYYSNRGYYKNQLERYDEAIEDFDIAIKLDSAAAFAINNKAFALLKLGEYHQALELVNLSLRLNSKNADAFKTRAEVYLALNEKVKASQDLRAGEELGHNDKFRKELKALLTKACE